MAGLLDKRRSKREEAETPTSSMADIAFLLLIFFLVTTTINVDTGIGMTLPPKLEEEQEPPPVIERNLMNVLVNAQGEVLLNDNMSSVGQIREEVTNHILNYGEDPDLSESPDDAVISIKTDAQTPYRIYIEVLDEVQMAYREIWNNVAQTGTLPDGERIMDRTYDNYEEYRSGLEPEDDNIIRENFPANISIAEPDTGG